ncbi:hypothetical protein [Bacillus massilinigeriensis]|uniref:hypothetical protein n=1 Tax=Bacillus mediterraneensis TaxID=1805474 RepID=UPI0008F8277C|nr:hypothetical protein [Bacillus mediterraneensis]
MRLINATFIASDDPDFGEITERLPLIADSVLIENSYGELNFLTIPPVAAGQEHVIVDRASAPMFQLMIAEDAEIDYELIENGSLLDFIRKYATNGGF